MTDDMIRNESRWIGYFLQVFRIIDAKDGSVDGNLDVAKMRK